MPKRFLKISMLRIFFSNLETVRGNKTYCIIIASGQVLTNNTNIEITKFWSQEPNGYTYPIAIQVPNNNMPINGYPVCIVLHGNGGNANQIVNQFSDILLCPPTYLNCFKMLFSQNVRDNYERQQNTKIHSSLFSIFARFKI